MDSPWWEVKYQIYKKRIKQLKSSGSGKKRDLHFNLPVPVTKDFITKHVFSPLVP
jgi:hypothetical protein